MSAAKREPLHPSYYARVFEGTPEGQAVLEELVSRFCREPYVKGGRGAERETLVRIGERRPINYILARINAANGVPTEEETDEG
jgi:hypothetical protein